jgi:putative ABC transport system permease protein
MPVRSRLSSLLRNTFRRRRVEDDLEAEVHAYLDLLIDEKRNAGLSEEAARRAALVELQGAEQVKESVRSTRSGASIEQIWRDLAFGARMLRRHRGFTAAAVLTLALGIGANSAIFTIVDTVVFRPLPYRDPSRLVKICGNARAIQTDDVSMPDFTDLQHKNRSFESMAADDGTGFSVVYGGSRQSVLGGIVTPEWLSTLGVHPVLGRAFGAEDARPGQDRVAILTHAYWRRYFASDPNVVGKTMTVDGQPFVIVGVLPPNVLRYQADFIKPLVAVEYSPERGHRDLDVFARLKPGVTLAQAQAELDTLSRALALEYPTTNANTRFTVVPLSKYYASIDPRARQGLVLMLGAVAFVLLIACVNVANLLLARAVSRGRECLIRAALGASRGRLVRQLLLENVLLFLAGGIAGTILARWSVDSLLGLAVATGYVPDRMTVAVDTRVFFVTLAVSAAAGVLFGLSPALQASRVDLNEGLRDASHTLQGGRRRGRVRQLLIVAELALSLVLLVGFGLLTKSFMHVAANAGNLPADRVLETSAEGGRSLGPAVEFWRTALDEVRSVAGVQFAAVTSRPPVHRARDQYFEMKGVAAAPGTGAPRAGDILISADYFKTLNIPLIAGRMFNDRDTASSPPVIIVSQTLARRYFPNDNPLGARIMVMERDPMTCCAAAGPVAGVWREIVGVVGDVRQANLDEDLAATMYRPFTQIVEHDMYLMARVDSAATAPRIASDLRLRLAAMAPGREWEPVLTLDQIIAASESLRLRRFVLVLLGTFAVLALLLAAVGVYGVMTYFVEERRREIGIRVALGASTAAVLRDVMSEAFRLTLAALVIGLAAAQVVIRLIAKMLFGVTATDLATYLSVWTLLTMVALIAAYLPARRASRVDPVIALREA